MASGIRVQGDYYKSCRLGALVYEPKRGNGGGGWVEGAGVSAS